MRRFVLAAAVAAVGVVLIALLGGSGERPRTHGSGTLPEAPPAAGPPAQRAPSGEQLGASVNRLFNDRTFTLAQIDSQLSALAQTGATIARSDALWEAIEPSPPVAGVHHYDWAFDDLIAGSLAAHRLRWLAILDYSAAWAQSIPGQDHSPPSPQSAYAAFAAAFAARYGAGGAFWRAHPHLPGLAVQTFEIWNEPDTQQFWLPLPDAATYAPLYLRARDAITAVDPTARVIVGGLTNVAAFLPAMLRAEPALAGHIDGVAIHAYGANPFAVAGAVQLARRTLSALGLAAVPLYVTEFGWTTSPPGSLSYIPAQSRPIYITESLAVLGHTDCAVAATVLYTWVTPEQNPANHEDWFGISPPGGGTSPDVAAFAQGLRAASTPAPVIRLCSG